MLRLIEAKRNEFKQLQYPETLRSSCIEEVFFAYFSFVNNFEHFLTPEGVLETGFIDTLSILKNELDDSLEKYDPLLDPTIKNFINSTLIEIHIRLEEIIRLKGTTQS
jgi:hypothetical protein